MLILTSVDGALRETADVPCSSALQRVVRDLVARRVPVILTSYHARTELARVAQELGLALPFIAESGAALCIPRGYFAQLPRLSGTSGPWEVIEFDPPSVEDAIDMLMWLFRVSGDAPLLIGVGTSWRDHLLLRHVDVPVVVRNPSVDQRELCAQFPEAYVTSLAGPSGWREAVLGASVTEADPYVITDAPAVSDQGG